MASTPRTQSFRSRFFPGATRGQWSDWQWQLQNRITTYDRLAQILNLSEEERAPAVRRGLLPLGITPYYASLLDRDDPRQPLRRTVVPTSAESVTSVGESADPLDEDAHAPVPGLIHRYPDRVLFLATGFCSVFCRYCTRSRMVGRSGETGSTGDWDAAIDYIAATPAVRDVLISGGDPLTLPDQVLERLIDRIAAVPHVEFLRIGTKVPMTLPQRITPRLVAILRRRQPLWLSIHVAHPDELTSESEAACRRLANAGIPLGSQTVLLKGINDSAPVLTALMRALLRVRVRPYYLYQCDPILGSAHFRTPVSHGLELMRGLHGHSSGYAVPTFVIDAPGGGGKIRLAPDYCRGREAGDLILENYRGQRYRYPDPPGGTVA